MTQQYFSYQTEPALANKVISITGKHDRFVSDVFGDADAENRTYTWLEAWQDDKSGLWYIDQYTRIPSVMDDMVHKKKISSIGLCFFDALHHCSLFHQAEEQKGRIVFPACEGNPLPLTHYREAAIAAGQVIDRDGIAQPCLNGRILTDGFFSRQSLAIAGTSVRTDIAAPLPAPRRDLAEILLQDISAGDAGTDLAPVAQYGTQKRDLVNAFKEVADAGDKLMQAFGKITSDKFQTAYKIFGPDASAYLVTVATLGIRPLIGKMTGNRHYNPEGHFKNHLKKFRSALSILPEGPEKSLLADFETAACSAFYFERAATHYTTCVEKRASGEKIHLGLPDIERGGRLAGKSEADIEGLKAQYLRGEMTHKSFLKKIHSVWDPSEIANIRTNSSWDTVYNTIKTVIQKEAPGHVWGQKMDAYALATNLSSLSSSAYLKISTSDTSGVNLAVEKCLTTDPAAPRIRVRLHEKINALEANLG